MRILLSAFLSIGFLLSCREEKAEPRSKEAIQLYSDAMQLATFSSDRDSARKALLLLNKATAIDSLYFLALYGKLMFYPTLGYFDSSLVTVSRLLDLRPEAHDLHLVAGFLHWRLGDTVAGRNSFATAIRVLNPVLDTMVVTNLDYEMLVANEGVALRMLDNDSAIQRLRTTAAKGSPALDSFLLNVKTQNKVDLMRRFTGESK